MKPRRIAPFAAAVASGLALGLALVAGLIALAPRHVPARPMVGAGSFGANANPLPVHGPLRFDGRSYGISTSNADNGPAIQRAVDAASAAVASWIARDGSRTPLATVFIAGAKDPYVVRTPVYLDGPSVRVVGEGAGSTHGTKVAAPIAGAYPPFVVGLSRTAGAVPGSSYRPDLFGKLDATVATASGQRRGVRTNGGLFVGSHGSPLSHGGVDPATFALDYWRATDCLTVDFAIEWFATPGTGIVFGAADSYYADQRPTSPPRPLLLKSNGSGSFSAVVGYQATQFGPATVVSHNFTLGTAGVHRVSIQVDLAARQVCVWDNGAQIAVSGSVPAGVRFAENEHAPWYVNNATDNTSSLDFALYGLCYSQSRKYANNGVSSAQVAHPTIGGGSLAIVGHPTGGTFTISYKGQTTAPIAWNASPAAIQSALQSLSTVGAGNVTVAQSYTSSLYGVSGANGFAFTAVPSMCDGSNLTGQVIPDSFRYMPSSPGNDQGDPWAIGFFGFTEPLGQRHVQVTSNVPGTPGAAWLADNAAFAPVTGVRFEDIEIAGAANANGYSTGVLLGYALDVHFDRAKISGAFYGLADMSIGANYVVSIKDCSLYGTDCGYFGYFTEVEMDTVAFPGNGRSALRLVGCVFDGRHLNVTFPGNPQYAFCSIYDAEYGGSYSFDDVSIDSEGDVLLRAGIYCERHADTQTSLAINNLYFGTTGSVPLIKLANRVDQVTWPTAILKTNLINANGTGPIVEVDGDGWVGEVRNSFTVANSDLNYTGTSGRPRVRVVNDFGLKLPMKYGRAYLGVSRIPNLGPVDGQYDEIRVALDGVWGSTTPPTWKGFDPSQSDPAATLAAYGVDHTAIAATLSGQASAAGYLTTYADVQAAAALFNGAALGQPSSWYVGLSTADANKAGGIAEVVGVSRVALANSSSGFTAASAGSKASAAAVTFGALPSACTIRSIFLADASTGGNVWAVVELSQPIAFAAGATPTINSGALTFTHLPLAGDFRGTLTDYGWGKLFDLMFRGTAFTAPANYYAALSTASLTRSSTSPTEPSGNGYARAAVASDAAHWNVYTQANWMAGQPGDVANLPAIAFPTATGSWGSCPYAGLMDASSSGNLWWAFPLVSPVSPVSGSAPSFAIGAMFLGL